MVAGGREGWAWLGGITGRAPGLGGGCGAAGAADYKEQKAAGQIITAGPQKQDFWSALSALARVNIRNERGLRSSTADPAVLRLSRPEVWGRQVVVDLLLGVKLMRGLRRPGEGGETKGGGGSGVISLLVNTVVHLIKMMFSRLKLTTRSINMAPGLTQSSNTN